MAKAKKKTAAKKKAPEPLNQEAPTRTVMFETRPQDRGLYCLFERRGASNVTFELQPHTTYVRELRPGDALHITTD